VERLGGRGRAPPRERGGGAVIYCVVPQALADELYDKLSDYYKDDPHVEVIIDRRGKGGPPGPHPADRDRRRRRIKGTFPPIEPTSKSS
jgi:hypothetical protein